MFMLRCGTPPFVANKLIVLYNKIQSDPVVFTVACADGFKKIILATMEKDPENRCSLDAVIRSLWLQIKPPDEAGGGGGGGGGSKTPGKDGGAAKDDAKWKAAVSGSAEKISLSSDDMMQSVHLARGRVESDDGAKREGGGSGGGDRMEKVEEKRRAGGGEQKIMSDADLEKRARSFKKKASIRQRSHENLEGLMEETPKKKEEDSDDEEDMFDFGDDDDDDE